MTEYIEIRNVSLWCGRIPVRVSFSYGTETFFDFAILSVQSDKQHGLGETLVPWDGPSLQWAQSQIETLPGKNASELDNLLSPWATEDERHFSEAISIALHDLVARSRKAPFWKMLGDTARRTIPLMPCLFPESPDEAAQCAKPFLDRGFRYLKVKLIGDLEEDLGRIRSIRLLAREDVILQGDANEGYDGIEKAAEAVEVLGRAGLNVFEDPLKGSVKDYRDLRDHSAGPARIMVDKLARSMEDLREVVSQKAADIVNFHPAQMGSIRSLLDHVNLAKKAHLPFIIGGTGFTGPGTVAYQQITSVVSDYGPAGEINGSLDHGMPKPLIQTLPANGDPKVMISDTPGLGVELDSTALTEFTVSHKTWN